MLYHWHLLIGRFGVYEPDHDTSYETRQEATKEARASVMLWRKEGYIPTGNIRKGHNGYVLRHLNSNNLPYQIRVVECTDDACLCQQCHKQLRSEQHPQSGACNDCYYTF